MAYAFRRNRVVLARTAEILVPLLLIVTQAIAS
jgi:hypothetical protein